MIIRMPADECYFVNWEKRQFSGFTPLGSPKLKKGDELQCDMQSQQIARFRVTKVKYFPEPSQQYFGECVDIDYLKEDQ